MSNIHVWNTTFVIKYNKSIVRAAVDGVINTERKGLQRADVLYLGVTDNQETGKGTE
jgi:hypothetical protein